MKLWLVERTDPVDWDEFLGFVVAAATEEEARATDPREPKIDGQWPVDPATLRVRLLGTAEADVVGIVLASFANG